MLKFDFVACFGVKHGVLGHNRHINIIPYARSYILNKLTYYNRHSCKPRKVWRT